MWTAINDRRPKRSPPQPQPLPGPQPPLPGRRLTLKSDRSFREPLRRPPPPSRPRLPRPRPILRRRPPAHLSPLIRRHPPARRRPTHLQSTRPKRFRRRRQPAPSRQSPPTLRPHRLRPPTRPSLNGLIHRAIRSVLDRVETNSNKKPARSARPGRFWMKHDPHSSSSFPIILALLPIGSSSLWMSTSRVLPPACSRPTMPISLSSSISRAARG